MNRSLEILQERLTSVLNGLDRNDTQRRPAGRPSAWTLQQIVEHLRLSYAATITVLETRIAKGTPTRARPSLLQWLGQLAVTRLGYFPKGRKAPAGVVPSDHLEPLTGEELQTLLANDLARMDSLLLKAESQLGPGRTVSHIVLGPLSIEQWRRFHLEHGRHHAKQIASLASSLTRSSAQDGLPGSGR